MIFKYHSFEVVPWGAILNVRGRSSNKIIRSVNTYTSSVNYTTISEALGRDKSFFVESKVEPIQITYSVSSKNGDLVEVQTNLTCTSTKVNGIITEFTLDNTNWFNQPFNTEAITIQRISTLSQVQISEVASNTPSFTRNGSTVSGTSKGNRIYHFNTEGNYSAPVGSSIVASYNYLKQITQTLQAIKASSSDTGTRVYVDNQPNQLVRIYNRTKNIEVSRSNLSWNYQLQKYFYYFYDAYKEVTVGDMLDVTYKYVESKQETLITTEVPDGVIHRGIISDNNKNKSIEDCIDTKNYFVFYTRDTSKPQYIYLKTDAYDGIQNGIIVRFEKEKPYIKLCCNNVKIETILQDSANYWSCDFEKLDVDSNFIYPKAVTNYNSRSKFSRYAKISWNKSETQQLYFGEEGTGGKFWGISGGSSSGYNLLAYTENHSTNNLTVTIPPIRNFSQPYYYVACTVNIASCSWYGNFSRYLNSNFTNYTEDGYLNSINNSSKIYINCDNHNIPEISSLEKWGDNKSFYKSGNYYMNPSDGLMLYTEWGCDGYVPCDGGDGCCQGGGDGCCQSGSTIYSKDMYAGGSTGGVAKQQSDGTWYDNGNIVFIPAGTYSVIAWVGGDPVIVLSSSSTGYAISRYWE